MVTDLSQLKQAADTYANTFAGQRDAYSYWTGEHWTANQSPLTADVVINAFTTGVPISGYVLGPDNYTHVACLDIDREDGQGLAIAIGQKLRQLGGNGYIERSRRGAHVWMVLDERRPGILVRLGLTTLIMDALGPARLCPGSGRAVTRSPVGRRQCPLCHRAEQGDRAEPHRDPRIEFRPASDRLPLDENGVPRLGHCIRLPTMPHHKTGKRYPLISISEGEQLSGKLAEMMTNIETCPSTVFDELASRAPRPLNRPPVDTVWPHGRPEITMTASEILRDLWGVKNAVPGRAIKCPAHDDQRPSLSIARDDERVWCHSPICELNNDGHGRGTYELTRMAPRAAHVA